MMGLILSYLTSTTFSSAQPTLGSFQFDRPSWKISQASEVGVASGCFLTTISKQKPNNTTSSLAGADLFKDSSMLFQTAQSDMDVLCAHS